MQKVCEVAAIHCVQCGLGGGVLGRRLIGECGRLQGCGAGQTVFNRIYLATHQLAEGDLDTGCAQGHQAITLTESIRSPRLLRYLTDLRDQTQRHPSSDTRELEHRINTLVTTMTTEHQT